MRAGESSRRTSRCSPLAGCVEVVVRVAVLGLEERQDVDVENASGFQDPEYLGGALERVVDVLSDIRREDDVEAAGGEREPLVEPRTSTFG